MVEGFLRIVDRYCLVAACKHTRSFRQLPLPNDSWSGVFSLGRRRHRHPPIEVLCCLHFPPTSQASLDPSTVGLSTVQKLDPPRNIDLRFRICELDFPDVLILWLSRFSTTVEFFA
jgi:hypothetical protein